MHKINKFDTAARNIIIAWEAKIVTKKTSWLGGCLTTVHGKMELLPSLPVRCGPYLDGAKDFSLDVYYVMYSAKSATSAYYLIYKNVGDVVNISGLIGNRVFENISYMPELTGFVNIDTVKVPPAWLNKTKDYLHSQFLSNNNMLTPVDKMRQHRRKIGFTSIFSDNWNSPDSIHSAHNRDIFDSGYQYDYAREVAHVDCSATEELESMFPNE